MQRVIAAAKRCLPTWCERGRGGHRRSDSVFVGITNRCAGRGAFGRESAEAFLAAAKHA